MKGLQTYRFTDGHQITSKLDPDEILKRMDRLDWLRVLTEGFDDGVGLQIYEKALRAYNKTDNFTGIIKLSIVEKDFISMMMDGNNDPKDIETLEFYAKY